MDERRRERLPATVTRQRTGLVGLAIPSLREPFFAELCARVLGAARHFGFSVTVLQTEDDAAVEHGAVNGRGFPEIDGVLLVPRFVTAADLTRRRNPLPVVLLGEHVERSTFSHVTVDNRLAMRDATQHLIDIGCARLAMVGRRVSPASDAAGRRELGFMEAIDSSEAATGQIVDVPGFDLESGQQAVRDLVAGGHEFDGLVCVNDSLAMGALAALRELGRAVPSDVAVTGFDDIPYAEFTSPPLTTIAPDLAGLARSAWTLLDRQILSPLAWTPDMEQVTVSHRLVVRGSSVLPSGFTRPA